MCNCCMINPHSQEQSLFPVLVQRTHHSGLAAFQDFALWPHGPPAVAIMAYNKDEVHTCSHMIRNLYSQEKAVSRSCRTDLPFWTIPLPPYRFMVPVLRKDMEGRGMSSCNTSLFPGSYNLSGCDEPTSFITSISHFRFKNNWFAQFKAFLHEMVPNWQENGRLNSG